MRVSYYITGHGYGHATRVIGQVQNLLLKGIQVDIITSLSPEFLLSNFSKLIDSSHLKSLQIFHRILDSGAIQPNPLSVDALLSLESYYNNIYVNRESIIDNEVLYLIDNSINIVIIDATPLALPAAAKAGIPSVIISNFTWDFTFEQFHHIILNKSNSSKIDTKYVDMIEQCIQDSCAASYYIRLPGETPLPKGFKNKVINGPLICRRAVTSKQEIRKMFNISIDSYVAVLGFGGFKMSSDWPIDDSYLPMNWYCFVLSADNDIMPSSRFIPLNRDFYVPDIINAADAFIGKLGYGTVSECLVHGTPLIYVSRTDWPEEDYLENFITKYNAGIKLNVIDFKEGNWEESLKEALSKRNSWDISELRPETAFDEISSIILNIIDKKL